MTDPTQPPQPTPQPPQPITQVPATTPPPQPQSPPPESYWQGEYDKLKNSIGGEVEQLKQQITSLTQNTQQTQQQAPKTTELDFSSIANMRADDGSMKPEYASALFSKDTPAQVRDQLWKTVNDAQAILDRNTNQNIAEVFGDRSAFDTTYQAATQHLSQQDQQALAAALGNPLLMQDGLKKLKGMADEKGWGQAPTEQPTNEPPAVGPHTSAPSEATTAIRPGSPEAAEAMKNPLYRENSPAGAQYRDRFNKRLAMGADQLGSIDNFL